MREKLSWGRTRPRGNRWSTLVHPAALALAVGCSSEANSPAPNQTMGVGGALGAATTTSVSTSQGATSTGTPSSANVSSTDSGTTSSTAGAPMGVGGNPAGMATTSASINTTGGGAANTAAGGASSTGGGGAASDTTGNAGTASTGSELGTATMDGSGSTDEQYQTVFVSRNDVPYVMITNGWGPGFGSHTISWEGTSFVVESMSGSAGSMGQPASYPSVFCGRYSVRDVPDCGLPASRDSLSSVRTGWRWDPGGNETGEYNAAYDIWVGDGSRLQGYLMVWLRDPPSYQPAGSPNMAHQGISVENVPGVWNIWDGSVNGLPIINWVRAEGSDSREIEFDVMDFVRDAEARGLSVPGSSINAVAVGFEIWEGPISGLRSEDFYVDVH